MKNARSTGDHPLPAALAEDPQLAQAHIDGIEPQASDLDGSEAAEHHCKHDGAIAVRLKVGEERGDVVGIEALGQSAVLADEASVGALPLRPEVAEHPFDGEPAGRWSAGREGRGCRRGRR